jgi:hypothetical protein
VRSRFNPFPNDAELPDPDERVDREWLIEFCTKQGWRSPRFWSSRSNQNAQAYRGRPPYPDRVALERELRRRAAAGEMHQSSLAAEMRYLQNWATEAFPNDRPPALGTLEEAHRDLYWDLRGIPRN